MSAETGDIVSRVYANFRGADFRGDEINITRSPDCLNVWRDYTDTESIKTRPGMVLEKAFASGVNGVYFYNDAMIVHSGTKLHIRKGGTWTELYSGVNNRASNAFVYENVWYFLDGKVYLQYDGKEIKEVEGYIPTTSIGRKPEGGGTIKEDINFLTPWRYNTFVADGKNVDVEVTNPDTGLIEYKKEYKGSTDFYLDVEKADDVAPTVWLYDQDDERNEDEPLPSTEYTYDHEKGVIKFAKAPKAPKSTGDSNIKVLFKKSIVKKTATGNADMSYRDVVQKCTLLQLFDNRVFISGHPDFPNYIFHCSIHDPTYFSDTDYYKEGLDRAAVKGLVAGNDALWVFREPSDANTTVFYHRPTPDKDYGAVYPDQHSSITTGCVSKAINFNDDICFFSERGLEGISGDITTEQVVAHRSTLIDPKLSPADVDALAEWKGYLLVFIGNKLFLADSRKTLTYEDHSEYEWFYWELEKAVKYATVHEGDLYIGTTDGVYTLTDNECDIESYWVTAKDKFKAPHKLKTTNKRGCVVEATGDISVYAKTEDTGFELIGTFENVTDYFVCRIKRKKFKDIQLKFHSTKRMSLETATLECFVGGYIKR